MISYDRIEVSEGIEVNKTSDLKECDVCHHQYFFNCQQNLCKAILLLKVLIIAVLLAELAKVRL